MEALQLTTNDIIQHVVKIGIDTYPPVDIAVEQTKLGVFSDEVRSRWPELFDRMESSSTDFVISKAFRAKSDSRTTAMAPTFGLTPRGPVFIAPLQLPPPMGEVGSEDEYMDLFPELRQTFLSSVGGRDCLRIGFVRELVFDTGQVPCHGLLCQQESFAGAQLKGTKSLCGYRDEQCNVRITIESAEIARTTRLPIGQSVTQEQGHGLKVELDVNNHELRALDEGDMETVLSRARALWPEALLEYLNSLGASE